MVIQTFLGDYAFIWLFVIVVVLVYAGLKKMGLPGSEWVLAITAFLIGFIVLSSTSTTDYLVNILPYLTIILVLTVLITLVLAFVTEGEILKDFKKYMAWAGFVIAILVIIFLAFSHFPTLSHMTPDSSNIGLSDNEENFKDFIYSSNFKESLIFVLSIVVVGFAILKTTVAKK